MHAFILLLICHASHLPGVDESIDRSSIDQQHASACESAAASSSTARVDAPRPVQSKLEPHIPGAHNPLTQTPPSATVGARGTGNSSAPSAGPVPPSIPSSSKPPANRPVEVEEGGVRDEMMETGAREGGEVERRRAGAGQLNRPESGNSGGGGGGDGGGGGGGNSFESNVTQFMNLKSLIANVEDEILSEVDEQQVDEQQVSEQQVREQPDLPSDLRSLSTADAINARFRKNVSNTA